jgi:hypothetical protein
LYRYAEADFANGKEEESVSKEQGKNDTVQANWDERNKKWNLDLDGARTEMEFLKEQLKTINAEDSEYTKKLFDEGKAREKAISNAEKENRQKLIDEAKATADLMGKESVRLVQEDLDEMNRITLGRSAIEEATVAREEFEKEFADKLDATADVQEDAAKLLGACDQRVKEAGGQEQLEEAKAKATAALEAQAALDTVGLYKLKSDDPQLEKPPGLSTLEPKNVISWFPKFASTSNLRRYNTEHAAAREEAQKRVAGERRRVEEQVMGMTDQFSESKTVGAVQVEFT